MKKCKHCGKEFKTGYRGRIKFCSDKCAHTFWNNQNNKHKPHKNKICKICGKQIEGRSYSYCSDECRKIGKRKTTTKYDKMNRIADDNVTINICLNCKKENCEGICELVRKVKGGVR